MMSKQDHEYIVHRPRCETLRGPANLLNADMVEVRVILRPLSRYETEPGKWELRPSGELVSGSVTIDRWMRVESKDHRVIFHLLRELLMSVARVYLGVDL
jgi:hypothetical protein